MKRKLVSQSNTRIKLWKISHGIKIVASAKWSKHLQKMDKSK